MGKRAQQPQVQSQQQQQQGQQQDQQLQMQKDEKEQKSQKQSQEPQPQQVVQQPASSHGKSKQTAPPTANQVSQQAAPNQNAKEPTEQPMKKVKKEPVEPMESPTPARSPRANIPEQPASKRSRQQGGAVPGRRAERSPSRIGGIASLLSGVRKELEEIIDVDGVREQLQEFPECVLLGGIAVRRELVAVLLGDQSQSNAALAAAALIAPGMRQPLALELRTGSRVGDPDAWLRSISEAAQSVFGTRLKVDPHRLQIAAAGCANLDVVDLPERSPVAGPPGQAKIEEMRVRHMGSPANLLVCLEPGAPLDLCRRFDPQLKRTVLLGAAAASAHSVDSLPASMLCGPAAARDLEARFAALCAERVPQWLTGLGKLEKQLADSQHEAAEMAIQESTDGVLRRARSVGISFGRAFQHIIGGTPGCTAGALTLHEELIEFACAAANGQCGTGQWLSAQSATAAAADVWAPFGGVEGYSAYIQSNVHIPAADVPLNGGAAFNRMLEEIEVAMRLAHPPTEELAGLRLAAVQAGGTGVHGHQRWDDVSAKLLLGIAFEPLRRRIRYVAARVAWTLRQQKSAVAEWMATLEDGPTSRLYSPLFPQHLAVLRNSRIMRDLVFGAFDSAAARVAETLLKNLEGTLSAGCLNPQIMLRPQTQPDLKPEEPKGKSGSASSLSRQRVKDEMRKRSGKSGGLPVQLQDRIFEPKEAAQALPYVELQLRKAFKVLANILANQAYAFSDTTLTSLTRRNLDEAMNALDFSPEQYRALALRQNELQNTAQHLDNKLVAIRRCVSSLRNANGRT